MGGKAGSATLSILERKRTTNTKRSWPNSLLSKVKNSASTLFFLFIYECVHDIYIHTITLFLTKIRCHSVNVRIHPYK